MKSIRISTNDYKRSHEKDPRGYGAWGFDIVDDSTGKTVETVFAPAMTFSDAKVWIKSYVRKNWNVENETGHLTVSVAP